MNLEIDRRCSSCGATVRQSAAFCPQCGQPVSHQSADSSEAVGADLDKNDPPPSDGPTTEAAPKVAKTVALNNQDTIALTPPAPAVVPADTVALPSAHPEPTAVTGTPKTTLPVHTERQGVTHSRGGFESNVRSRVNQLRKASSVVIDQAAYDPSLRFLLVAAGLFLLFLILLFISKVIG